MTIELQSPIGEAILVNEERLEAAMQQAKRQHGRVLAIVTATKPCFYKLFGLMREAAEQELPFFILHSGQHYDDVVGHGFAEFDFAEHLGVDLRLRGDLSQKSAELYVKAKVLAEYLRKRWPATVVVPYVNGDTITAGLFPGAWLFATNRGCIQGEAGLRSMSPKGFTALRPDASAKQIIDAQWGENATWIINRTEPFPEQYDTFVSAAGCDYFFPAVQLNTEHLVREGYDPKRMMTVGNTVVDAVKAKRQEPCSRSVFEEYPKLAEGAWLRMDIHRRENLNERRFKAIIGTLVKLVESGERVAFIELTAARRALEHYGLRDRLVKLAERENFLFTPVWKEYAHVIEFLDSDHCWAILTDSGSMQEEMNELGKPCFTARFSTDRPETLMAKANLLVPPLETEQMLAVLAYAKAHPEIAETMRKARKLYGTGVSKKIITEVAKLFAKEDQFFSWAHDRLDIYREKGFLEYL